MMKSQLEANKQLVRAFYNLAFNQQQPEEAVRRYVGLSYRQHNPHAGDGAEACIQFVRGFLAQVPQLSVDIKRTIAEGDFVVTHCLLKLSPEDHGSAVMDIFR